MIFVLVLRGIYYAIPIGEIIPQRFKGPSFAIVTAQLVGLVFDIDRTVSKSRWQNGCLMSLMS
jgi:hypothetical protein